MKRNHVLIDYENVQLELADALAADYFDVWGFVGVQQTKVKLDLVKRVQRKRDAAHIVEMTSSGRNALDFHIAGYLGQITQQEPEAYCHVISKDGGLDPFIQHLRGRGLLVARWGNVNDIPLLKQVGDLPAEDKLSVIIEYLVRRGNQRPRKLRTLLGSIAALFNPKLKDEEAAALANRLQTEGVFEVVEQRLVYGLPD